MRIGERVFMLSILEISPRHVSPPATRQDSEPIRKLVGQTFLSAFGTDFFWQTGMSAPPYIVSWSGYRIGSKLLTVIAAAASPLDLPEPALRRVGHAF